MKAILSVCVIFSLFAFSVAYADVLDDFEYADDAAIKAAYADISGGGQSATTTVSTTVVRSGVSSGEIALSYDGTQWAAGTLEQNLASPLDTTAFNVVRLSVYGDAAFSGIAHQLSIKFIDSSGEALVTNISQALDTASWSDLEIPLGNFADDPYDANPGISADPTDIVTFQFYFQNNSVNAFTATVYLDDFEIDTQSLPGDGRDVTATMDGDFSEWLPGDLIDVAPNEVEDDSDGSIEDIWLVNDEDYLYISLLLDDTLAGLVNILIDADMSTATGLTYGWWASGGEKLCQLPTSATSVSYFDYAGSGGDWAWNWFGGGVEDVDMKWGTDTVANDRVELRVSRAWLGSVSDGAQCRVVINSEVDGDYAPTSLGSQTYTYNFVGAYLDVQDWTLY